MARFLFTYWPFPGHIHPHIAMAHALRERGHEVSFYTGSLAQSTVEEQGFRYFPFSHVDEVEAQKHIQQMGASPRGLVGRWRHRLRLKAMWRTWVLDTVPAQLKDLEAILAEWEPDVIVCDAALWGPVLVLYESTHIPVAVSPGLAVCILPGPQGPVMGMPLPRPRNGFARLRARVLRGLFRLVTRDIQHAANALRSSYGLPALRTSVTAFAGQMPLYLVTSTPEFDYQRDDLPRSVHYIGPCLWNKPAGQPTPEWLTQLPKDRPVVHVSQSTVPGTIPLVLRTAAEALGGLPLEVIMTTGSNRSLAELGLDRVARNVRVLRYVAHSDLLPRTSVVVTTGGAGTVLAALKEGVPLLVIPIGWDQPENAWRVVEAGAGLHLPLHRCTPQRLRDGVMRLLKEDSFRVNARRVASNFAQYGGAPQAAALLEELSDHCPHPGSSRFSLDRERMGRNRPVGEVL